MIRIYISFFLLTLLTAIAGAQTNGTLRGAVTLGDSGNPIHGARITVNQLRRSVETDENGKFEIPNLPPGKYDIVAHLDLAPDVLKTVQFTADGATINFEIKLTAVRDAVTVTASGAEESTFNSMQSVSVVGALDMAKRNPVSLGDALDHELGVTKRSGGPATSRPVIRGFSNDRVQVLQDGQQIGSLGAQSSDHAEPVDLMGIDRIEVVKGPATLLYGSSAIGGVVNAISGHDDAHSGLRGFVTALGSSNNYQGGGSGGIEYGTKKWLLWLNGGGQRNGEYNTPIGRVRNSYARADNFAGGFGYFADKSWFSTNYSFDSNRYGAPYDKTETSPEIVYLNPQRQSLQFKFGFRDLQSFVSGAQFSLQYNDYHHSEINAITEEVNTAFKNKTFLYRGTFDEKKTGKLSGTFGFWGMRRDYSSSGKEAIAPPTMQNSFAAFTLQTLDFEHFALQFGGRVEHNGYDPTGLRARSFTGFSGAAGIRVPLPKNTVFVANYSHSYRAPGLEELYNHGPHGGNSTYEIGNVNLNRELSDGIDVSLRHSSQRFRTEANFYYYRLRDFVYLAPTGNIVDGLIEANYAQGLSRYTGAEAKFDANLSHNVWLLSSFDFVNAKLTATNTPLPRIPPLRGHIGLEWFYKDFRVNPELTLVRKQDNIFPTETATDGYATFDVTASYTWTKQHHMQIISLNAFNLTNELYRNHLSFIKDFAPEIGRGLRVVYTLRFF